MTLRCIAVDDEPFALEILADDILKIPFLTLDSTYSNANEAEKRINEGGIDLLFLDIQMPILRGTDFLRGLENPPLVIFTTAYEQYALEGFELNVVDYLLKPIPFDRFKMATERALERFAMLQQDAPQTHPHIFVFSEYNKIKLFTDDILYIEGLKDYVKIYTTNRDKPILTRLNLKKIEAKLPNADFCRVHQSFIVSLSKISSFQKSKLQMGKVEIPIGERFLAGFEVAFIKY